MRSLILLAAAVLGLALLAPAQAVTPVSVVYFYPKEQTPNQANIDLIDPLMDGVVDWYGEQVGYTFEADSVSVVRGAQRTNKYLPDWWGIVLRELGYFCNTGHHLIILHESLATGWGGGADCGLNGGGTAVVSEDLVDQHWPYAGVVPHELGHTFTLPHDDDCFANPTPPYCEELLMFAQWFYPDVGLAQSDVDILLTHPQFTVDVTDTDEDGWLDTAEAVIGTDPLDDCGIDAWPPDIDNDFQISSGDLSFVAGAIGQSVPPASARLDINRPMPDGQITSADLSAVGAYIGQTCTP